VLSWNAGRWPTGIGGACWWLEPLQARLAEQVFASQKLFADDTTIPVLDPGRGRRLTTKTGRLWVYARDDRPWGGPEPPAAVYFYSADRKAERPAAHLGGFCGILQVDGYAGFERLTADGNIALAACWAHARRKFYDLHEACSLIATAKLNEVEPFGYLHGFVYINPSKGIRSPRDLIGRRVGAQGYQTACSMWMKGILEDDFDVPHREVTWVLPGREDIAFDLPRGLSIEYASGEKSDEQMLVDGELDAIITPQVPVPLRRGDKRIARLFPNYRELETEYFRRTAIFPIMHGLVIRQDIIERYPWVPANLARAFHDAKMMTYQRVQNPRVVPLAWFGDTWEEQAALMGKDPWEYGLTPRNVNNLNTALLYAKRQGIIKTIPQLTDLFIDIPSNVLEGMHGF